jgi:hypothetical protein
MYWTNPAMRQMDGEIQSRRRGWPFGGAASDRRSCSTSSIGAHKIWCKHFIGLTRMGSALNLKIIGEKLIMTLQRCRKYKSQVQCTSIYIFIRQPIKVWPQYATCATPVHKHRECCAGCVKLKYMTSCRINTAAHWHIQFALSAPVRNILSWYSQ